VNLLGFLLFLKVPVGALCFSSCYKVVSSHVVIFLVLRIIVGSTDSCGSYFSSLVCSGEHVLYYFVSSCSSSSLDSIDSSIDFLNAILSLKVMSLLISVFYCPRT
jgi:hypothetical protein